MRRQYQSMAEDTLQAADAGLLGEARAGASPLDDIAAVHALYEQRVFRFLLMNLRDRDAALSLTQDTFLNAWRYRASFRGECAIATWLMRIAVNLLRDHTRTEQFKFWKRAAAEPAEEVALRASAQTADKSLAAHQTLAHVMRTVEKLSAKQRQVFLLRFVEEMELHEIAHATGMPLATVKSHLYRALDHVRAEHKPNEGGAKR